MFGDPAINPKRFEVRCLKDLYFNEKEGTKCGPFGSALKKEEYRASGIPVWNMDNISPSGCFVSGARLWISESKYRQLEAYAALDGDILISRAGTVGKMCVLKSKFTKSIISTNLIRLRFGEQLSPLYFVSLMTYCKGRLGRLKTGPDGAFTHMNTGILDKLMIPLPSLELQKKFEGIVDSVKQCNGKKVKQLQEIETLSSALAERAFRGELTKRNKAA